MKEQKISIEEINELARKTSEKNVLPYEELPEYDLFLSQVIDYLNDKFKNEKYTKNIVQNYIKGEIISKPESGKKRGYTKLHLIQLVLVSYMRPILTSEEMNKVFRLAFNHINDREDDIISWEKAYKIFCKIQENSCDILFNGEYFNEDKLKKTVKELNLKSKEDEERISVFLIVMTLIAQASAIKGIAQRILERYQG